MEPPPSEFRFVHRMWKYVWMNIIRQAPSWTNNNTNHVFRVTAAIALYCYNTYYQSRQSMHFSSFSEIRYLKGKAKLAFFFVWGGISMILRGYFEELGFFKRRVLFTLTLGKHTRLHAVVCSKAPIVLCYWSMRPANLISLFDLQRAKEPLA